MSATIETLELHTNPPNHDVDKTIELLPQWRKYPDSWTTLVIGEQLSECFIELIWKPLDQFFFVIQSFTPLISLIPVADGRIENSLNK